ncbi:hypothetical protein [Celeribacter sp.]|uniref:hypothetical protein n=1 Tax=Celeribacter sp. TaxID=1890673 RepID=UPI003A95D010
MTGFGSVWRRLVAPLLRVMGAGLICFAGVAAPAHAEASGVGLDAPALAYNLAPLRDWEAAQPFINLMRTVRPWVGNAGGTWGAVSHSDLREAGVFDASGWPRFVPEGVEALVSILAWNSDEGTLDGLKASRAGDYVLRYRGAGALTVSGDVRVTKRAGGEIRFTNPEGGPIILTITETDPAGEGDWLRDITLMRAEDVPLYEVGAVFDPDWVKAIRDARVLRFMNWLGTNVEPTRGGYEEFRPATAQEIVALSNHVGADPWITVPHYWNETQTRAFARELRDGLDPTLTLRVEFSNEVWNGIFPVHQWAKRAAQAEWGEEATLGYAAKAATEMALLWEEEFAARSGPKPALVNVLSGQTANPDVLRQLIDGEAWQSAEPSRFAPPASVFEEIAIASYVGGQIMHGPENGRAALAALDRGGLSEWMTERLFDADQEGGLVRAHANWQAHADLARARGVKLVAYEGGQHLMPAGTGLEREDVDRLTAAIGDYLRSAEMANVYAEMWERWMDLGAGPFMHYSEMSRPSRHGHWGLRAYTGDASPRVQTLDRFNAEASAARVLPACDCYLHGVTRHAGDAGGELTGTARADVLIGGAGNDNFRPETGQDGVYGGAGEDAIYLPYTVQEMRVTKLSDTREEALRLDGPDSRIRMVGVEWLVFADGRREAAPTP